MTNLTKSLLISQLFKSVISDLKSASGSGELHGPCPYEACRERTKHTFYVNETSGLFKCHRCGTQGNAISFAKDFGKDPTPFYDKPAPSEKIDYDRLKRSQDYLAANPDLMRSTWQPDIVTLLGVGFDEVLGTEVFPIRTKTGDLKNVIYHKEFQKTGSRASLYPLELIQQYNPSYAVIVEGLPDMVSALSFGLQAVCSTGGSGKVPENISDLGFFNYLYIIPDNDRSGEAGAELWIMRLRRDLPHVRVRLGDISPFVDEKGDLSNYFDLQ